MAAPRSRNLSQRNGRQVEHSRRQFLGGALGAVTAAPLLVTVGFADDGFDRGSDNSMATGRAAGANGWQGPRPTSKELGIDTPLPYLNDSWKIATELIDRGRQLYHEGNGLGRTPNRPGGFPGAWLPDSLGRRQPQIYPWDERDTRPLAKMIAYLWADERGLFEEYERNCFVEQILKNGDFLAHEGVVAPYVLHAAMFMVGAGDLGWCYGVTPAVHNTILRNIVKLVKRTREIFDPERSGFLSVGKDRASWYSGGFWGSFQGEPNHVPANYDGRNKLVTAGMAMAVFTKRLRDAARELGAPEADMLAKTHVELVAAIEDRAWSEKDDYYYLQRDENSDRWFLSMNGQCEESRETDIMPYYAAEACEIPARINAVGRVLNRALLKDRVFPMPGRWPTYAWYSPTHPNGVDQGEDTGWLGGAWDTPYLNCVDLLSRLGLQQAVQRAVLRRAEVAHRDQDFLESYRLDGTVDHARFHNRDRYIVSATAHLSSIIEGLFGITPARTGFAEVNLWPNLPLYRRHRHTTHPSDWAGRDNRICVHLGKKGRMEMVVRYDEDTERIKLRTTALGILAHIRLPLDLGSRFRNAMWNGQPVKARIERGMDSDFVHIDHRLDGGTLIVQLAPHPQKGKGTTPSIFPEHKA